MLLSCREERCQINYRGEKKNQTNIENSFKVEVNFNSTNHTRLDKLAKFLACDSIPEIKVKVLWLKDTPIYRLY